MILHIVNASGLLVVISNLERHKALKCDQQSHPETNLIYLTCIQHAYLLGLYAVAHGAKRKKKQILKPGLVLKFKLVQHNQHRTI